MAKHNRINQHAFKSGPVHEFILSRVERSIGSLSPRFSFQRHSEIARELGLQPDSVVSLPDGRRVLIEVCCNNLTYDARNIVKERQVTGVVRVIAVAPNQRLKEALQRALAKCPPEKPKAPLAALFVLDAGQCLSQRFDWLKVLDAVATPGEGASDGPAVQ